MAAKGGNVKVRFGADTRDLERGAAKAGRAIDAFSRHGTKAGSLLGSSTKHLLAYAGGITSIAAAAVAAKDAVKFTEDLAKGTAALSRTTGLDTKTASEWVETARVRGVESQQLNRGFITLAKNMRQAELGSKGSARAFKDLGVSQQALASGDLNRVLFETADLFRQMPDGAKQAALAQQLFGRQSQTLIPLLNQGSGKLKEQLGLVDEYGVALDKHGVQQALKAVEAQRKWQLSLDGLKVAFASGVIPWLTKGVTAAAGFVREMRSGEGAGGKFAAKLKSIWRDAQPVVETMADGAKAIVKFADAHPAVTKLAVGLVAVGVAVKSISWAGQITGITKVLKLAGTFGSVGAKGGLALADGIASAFFPQWSRRSGGIRSTLKRTFSGIGGSAGESFASSAAGNIAGGASGGLAGKVGRSGVTGKLQTVFGGVGKVAGLAFKVAFVAMLPDLVSSIADQIKQKFPEVSQYSGKSGWGELFRDWANAIAGGLGRRRGGMVFQGGGTVPALVSSGEVIVEPGGSAWRAPGPPVAADNVPAMLRPGSAVLTWDGQARMAAGASLAQAVAMQSPHFAGGGWVRTGATIDNTRGQAPTYSDHGGMSFAELLEAGTNAGMRPDATQLLGLPRKRYGMAMETSILARMPGSSKSYRIWKNDVGSGQPGNGHFTIDLHGKIASKLGWHPNQDIEIKRDDGTGDSLTAGGDPPRTITTTRYAPPSPGSGRSSRSAFDSGFESGVSDPFGLVRSQDRSDYYNSTKRGLFGTWTTSKRTLPGTPARHPGQGSAAGGRAGKLVEWLGTQVGYHEGPGNSNKYGPSAAWCGYFVQYGLGKVAGLPISSDMGYVPHIRDMIGSHAAPFKGPVSAAAMQPGDVITWPGHTGFYIGGGQAISGNYGDGVRKHGSTAPGPIVKAGRPAYRRGGRIPRFRGGGVVSRVRGGHSQLLPTASKVAGGFSGDTTPTRNAAYSTLWKLIGLGIGRGDEPSVKSTYARELSLIDRLGYDDLRGLSQDVKSIYRRQFGSTPRARTIRARLTGVLGRIDAAIGRSIGRPLGVADSVEEDISARGGLLPDQLTLGGIDPDSKEGIDATIDFNNRSITRLWQRRAALKDALARAKRAKRPDVAKRISDEIKDIDSQVTTFAASNVRLRRSRISAPTNAESQAGTTSGGGGADADLQAQLDQANVRATVAQRTAGLSEAFIRTAFGSGDIGRGGSYAWTAAGGSGAAFQPGMSITINTLHPGDSQTLAAIADAATAGMGQQGFVTSPRAVSGV